MVILGAYYLVLCVYLLCLLLNKSHDPTSLQVRWEDCSQMWDGVRKVHLQTAVYWSKLWSLCRRILWILPSVHPYGFSSILVFCFAHFSATDVWKWWLILSSPFFGFTDMNRFPASYSSDQRLNPVLSVCQAAMWIPRGWTTVVIELELAWCL